MEGQPQNTQSMEHQPNLIIDATRAHFVAKSTEALARFALYTSKPVGVGDHPDVVGEAVRALEDHEHAESVLERLRTLLGEDDERS